MSRIYCLGETLLDIIFKNDVALSSCPGGAMLNTAVSLCRSGLEVYLISEYGNDQSGDLITRFLQINGVQTNHIYRYTEEQTGIALAFLNEENESNYSFYKKYPQKRLDIRMPDFTAQDILLYGSFYSVDQKLRPQIKSILQRAKAADSLFIYDPNIRSPHKKDMPEIIDNIKENIQYADLIRGSHEDFQTIFEMDNAEEVFNVIPSDKITIYTHSHHGVWLRSRNQQYFYQGKKIKTKSTIGAGDSFNAGLIYALSKYINQKNQIQNLVDSQWNDIISVASAFAQEVCMSYDNFIMKKT